MLIVKLVLLPLAVWRLYRLFALDTGPHAILRKFRVKLGVKYTNDYKDWTTADGSWAEGITCVKCAPIYISIALTLIMLFLPDWVYLLCTAPFNASAIAIILENIVYAPRDRGDKKVSKRHTLSIDDC
ncbi:hypothetical protein LCGC14_2542090 [marine sediment metagenome]|uniref:Uncharacterized protein n=1 Tax=marine sediment metagenome TaxID=412755 RepID=A0A0F9DII0_9ZZZZ